MATSPPWDMPRDARSRFVDHACDHHGEAMLGLAVMILGGPAEAELAVVDAISDAYARSLGTRAHDSGSLRRELARLTYWRCIRGRGPGTANDPPAATTVGLEPGSASLATESLRTLPVQERAAIALCLYGEHTYQEAADLLALPSETVAELLSLGLHRLAPHLRGVPPTDADTGPADS